MPRNQIKKLIVKSLVAISIAGFVVPDLLPNYAYFLPVAEAATGVPEIISYQGRLTDASGALLNGNFNFRFSIYDSPNPPGGTKLWPAGTPGTNTLAVTDGVFNVNLGDTANGFSDALDYDFQSSDTVYLQVEVFNTATSGWETLSPRQQINSAGYAINAGSVLGRTPGTGADNILQLDNSGAINIAGDIITAGDLQGASIVTNNLTPTGALTVGAAGQTALLQGSVTTITSNGAGNDVIINSANTIELQDDTNIAGSLDVSDVIQAGSGNVDITLATGALNADALGLITGGGLATSGNKLGLLQSCSDGEILKWDNSTSAWICSADALGGAGSLQDVYDNAAALTTSSGKEIDITLADSAVDSNFIIYIASGSGSKFAVQNNGTDILAVSASGGTGVNECDLTVNNALVIAGDTISDFTGSGLSVSGNTLASTLGTSVDLGSEVTGFLPITSGGTGTNTLANLIALGTDTTGNFVAGISGNTQIGVSGSGSENAGVSLSINGDSIGDAQLTFNTGQNLTTSDSPTFGGLPLSDLAGGGSQCVQVNSSGVLGVTGDTCGTSTGISSLQLAGSSGSIQTLNDGDTITIAAGSGITTTAGASDTVTIASTLGTSVDLSSEVTGTLPVGSGGTGTGTALTAGSVVFAGASGVYSQDNSNFFYDDSNNRGGIGTNSPSVLLQVAGDGIGDAGVDLLHQVVGIAGIGALPTAVYQHGGDDADRRQQQGQRRADAEAAEAAPRRRHGRGHLHRGLWFGD